ncbi:hypothetical protein EVAR_47049_1 [Eumeta japonica]|uniref:HTH CENPB-type domain-containing protein n=1 Tax=Eumeta variegata TaxID=151549 RepID=A0A4C1ZQ90_EUMVA|nr:hypothetical protein EVAR_47049_1 [Eumeta japonica]
MKDSKLNPSTLTRCESDTSNDRRLQCGDDVRGRRSIGHCKRDRQNLTHWLELTVKYDLSRPRTWDDNEMASEEWFRMFIKRNPELSALAAQIISLSRAARFNRSNVDAFYDNLATVMDHYRFEP